MCHVLSAKLHILSWMILLLFLHTLCQEEGFYGTCQPSTEQARKTWIGVKHPHDIKLEMREKEKTLSYFLFGLLLQESANQETLS